MNPSSKFLKNFTLMDTSVFSTSFMGFQEHLATVLELLDYNNIHATCSRGLQKTTRSLKLTS